MPKMGARIILCDPHRAVVVGPAQLHGDTLQSPDIRAGMALNPEMAQLTRAHNDANVLTLAAKYTPENQLEQIVSTFLSTPFEAGRHVKRVEKIEAEERNHGR